MKWLLFTLLSRVKKVMQFANDLYMDQRREEKKKE